MTTNSYDANGSLTSSTTAGVVTAYTYDVRNKLASATLNGATTTYVYDDAGDRVSETTGGATTTYLTDTANPTGYDQPLEETVAGTTTPARTYLIGDRVFGQADGSGNVSYLLIDGHGSTQAMTNAGGTITSTFSYDAFGDPIGFNPATAGTEILFGGDGLYDAPSGLDFHGDGGRETYGFLFIETNPPGNSSNSDPLSLHEYLYAEADPINENDPSGDFGLADTVVSTGLDLADEGADAAGAYGLEQAALAPVEQGVDALEGTESGFNNAALSTDDSNYTASFLVGFASGYTTSALNFAGAPCWLANGVGGSILDFGNDYINNGSGAFSLGGVLEAIGAGLFAGLTSSGCFLAGTPVLLGNGKTEEAINDISVGDRVATDGGVANSPDGKTRAADPNATAVNPKTWRELTITAGDWDVQTLEPLSWIKSNHVKDGSQELVSDFVNVAEMGVPAGLAGTVDSISACPKIQGGPGRVVLATVSHLNSDVYHLTLKNAAGKTETLGVTGYHRYYDVNLGWVHVQEMYTGEILRGADGNLTVTSLIRDPGTDRVYNMTVEADHVYYVGDLQALVHNTCATQDHHPIPKFLGGDEDQALETLDTAVHQELHADLYDVLDELFADEPGYPGSNGSTAQWARFLGATEGAQAEVGDALIDLYTQYDGDYGTNLVQALFDNIAAGNFTLFP